MALTRSPSTVDLSADAFLVEFLNSAGFLVAVSPLYVVGVEETVNGVAIRTARGSVADQFFVAGPVRAVLDRLRSCWHRAQDSFLANFMRCDLGALEDRLMQRVVTAMPSKLEPVDRVSLAEMVRSEIESMAAGDVNTKKRKTA